MRKIQILANPTIAKKRRLSGAIQIIFVLNIESSRPKYPTLALVYYHCCSTDPHAAIFNYKLKSDVETSVTWDCISNLIGSPIGQGEAMLCQETFNNLDQSHNRIAACASCCECLLSADDQQGLVEMKIDDLPSEFLLTELQIERLTTLPHDIFENHIQVVKHNGIFYHLNPDLVFDVNQIPATATRALRELPGSSQRALISKP